MDALDPVPATPAAAPAFEATVWSRLTLTRDRNHIREIAFEGVVRAE